jgi:hypothetical protein
MLGSCFINAVQVIVGQQCVPTKGSPVQAVRIAGGAFTTRYQARKRPDSFVVFGNGSCTCTISILHTQIYKFRPVSATLVRDIVTVGTSGGKSAGKLNYVHN